MSDQKTGQGVKTFRDDEFKQKLVDGQSGETATKILSVNQDGEAKSAGVNDYGIGMLVLDEDGNYCHPAADSNCQLKVVVSDDDDDVRVHDYAASAALAESASENLHDIVVTSAKKVKELEIIASASGLFKYEIGEFDGTATFDVRAVLWTSPASPAICCKVCLPEITGDGSKAIRVKVTNFDDDDNCAYSTICYIEKA